MDLGLRRDDGVWDGRDNRMLKATGQRFGKLQPSSSLTPPHIVIPAQAGTHSQAIGSRARF
ncbi:hypothetical protein [Glacieibacterium sp.]|uniref:hypothetical protein n=1 Tax=Glacieibacterium sp. TaxID=2860237 RepID=UPI003B00F9DD